MSLFCFSEMDCGEPKPLLNGGVSFLSGSQNQYHSVIQYHCNEPFYTPLGGANCKILVSFIIIQIFLMYFKDNVAKINNIVSLIPSVTFTCEEDRTWRSKLNVTAACVPGIETP